jgi:hypothetical protein
MVRPIVTDTTCEALFASALQRSDAVTAEAVADAISHAMSELGAAGCASRMAEEFGEHPEAACDRMQWVRDLVRQFFAGPPSPASGPASPATKSVQGAA